MAAYEGLGYTQAVQALKPACVYETGFECIERIETQSHTS
jgi:hypothetical protein